MTAEDFVAASAESAERVKEAANGPRCQVCGVRPCPTPTACLDTAGDLADGMRCDRENDKPSPAKGAARG